MAVTHQNHKVSTLSLNEKVILYLQVERLKAGVITEALSASVLKLKSN